MKTILILSILLISFHSFASETDCTPDGIGGMDCTTDSYDESTSTHCDDDFMGGFHCTTA